MATYPNNFRTGVGFLPNYAFYGIMPYFQYNAEIGSGAGCRFNCHIGSDGEGFPLTASIPDGYGMKTPFPPIKAGGISAWNDTIVTLQMTGALIQGGPMEGTADITFSQSGALSMVVSMAGTAAVVTLTGDNMVLRMTVGLNGTGAFQLTGTNNLALIVPFEGIGSVVTMGVGSTDLRELLSLSGEWTPFTELSPEGLANAVWSSLVSQYQDDGTMGKALSTASSGGVDLGALAAAVWTYATRNMPAAERDATAAAVIAAAQVDPISANIKEVNDTTIDGAGTAGDPWGPA